MVGCITVFQSSHSSSNLAPGLDRVAPCSQYFFLYFLGCNASNSDMDKFVKQKSSTQAVVDGLVDNLKQFASTLPPKPTKKNGKRTNRNQW